jgi:transposase-like protein
MAWKTMDVQEQRVRFVVAASREEESLTALCQEFGISRPTGMSWKRCYQQAGLAGIVEQSRKPHRSPARTASELEHRVVEVRPGLSGWLRGTRIRLSRLCLRSTHHNSARLVSVDQFTKSAQHTH